MVRVISIEHGQHTVVLPDADVDRATRTAAHDFQKHFRNEFDPATQKLVVELVRSWTVTAAKRPYISYHYEFNGYVE